MCRDCGCGSDRDITRTVQVDIDLRDINARYAAKNRASFYHSGILALNLLSSPGSGKTSLLTRTIHDLKNRYLISVIEGDQQTSRDAERIRATGVPALQINTGKGCHLDARMIGDALPELNPAAKSLLFIENVGNLVCPAEFDLGEASKVVILSVTEGEDKPLKYPHMFQVADLMLINKIDLMPHVDFDVQQCIRAAQRVKPGIEIIQLSAATGQGMLSWYEWIARQQAAVVPDAGTLGELLYIREPG